MVAIAAEGWVGVRNGCCRGLRRHGLVCFVAHKCLLALLRRNADRGGILTAANGFVAARNGCCMGWAQKGWSARKCLLALFCRHAVWHCCAGTHCGIVVQTCLVALLRSNTLLSYSQHGFIANTQTGNGGEALGTTSSIVATQSWFAFHTCAHRLCGVSRSVCF